MSSGMRLPSSSVEVIIIFRTQDESIKKGRYQYICKEGRKICEQKREAEIC